MSTGTSPVSPPRSSLSVANGRDTIRRSVLEIIQREAQSSIEPDQLPRSFGRLPIEITFRLLPVSFDGTDILMDHERSEPIPASTRDVSFEGMAFEHPVALEDHLFVAFFPALGTMELAMLFERLWSNKSQHAPFLSGGRFVGVVTVEGAEGKPAGESAKRLVGSVR